MGYIFNYIEVKLKVKQSHYRLEVPRGFHKIKIPRLVDNIPAW